MRVVVALRCRAPCEDRAARRVSHPPAFVRHPPDPPARARVRHQDGAGAPGAPGREHDHAVPARLQLRRAWRAKRAGFRRRAGAIGRAVIHAACARAHGDVTLAASEACAVWPVLQFWGVMLIGEPPSCGNAGRPDTRLNAPPASAIWRASYGREIRKRQMRTRMSTRRRSSSQTRQVECLRGLTPASTRQRSGTPRQILL